MHSLKTKLAIGLLLLVLLSSFSFNDVWGFFAHRRINRLAVFTLPKELIPFYKRHIEYLTQEAIAPDKRRYVVATEGIRHYIDLDAWGELPFDNLPKNIVAARRKYVEVVVLNEAKDSIRLFGQQMQDDREGNWQLNDPNLPYFFNTQKVFIDQEDYEDFFYENIYNALYESSWEIDCEILQTYFNRYDFALPCEKATAVDTFVKHGVLPYNLARLQRSLTKAMEEKDRDRILRISADMGHYIGDAHVPLHTTSNYNGQQTNQLGIHAFWETRLPELYADENYDFWVGQSTYIKKPVEHYWNIVLNSHSLVQEVLTIEKRLSEQFPKSQQDCFEERGESGLQRMPCRAYAKAYHKALKGQVENQMRSAIHSVGSAWYTAWIDAGQPNFNRLRNFEETEASKKEKEAMEIAVKTGKIFGRKH